MKIVHLLAAFFACYAAVAEGISDNCLKCICGIESNGGNAGCGFNYGGGPFCEQGCNLDSGTCSCGPYQIKEPYFTDCSTNSYSVPFNDWVLCAKDHNCAKKCVKNYMDRYGTWCTGKAKSQITCEEYGGIHNGGPSGCKASWTSYYRSLVSSCCSSIGC